MGFISNEIPISYVNFKIFISSKCVLKGKSLHNATKGSIFYYEIILERGIINEYPY